MTRVADNAPIRLRWAVEVLSPDPADKILEIGCGTGVAATLIAERLTSGHVYAIDRSASAIARAHAHPRVKFEVLAATDVRRRGFDKALAFNVALNANDLEVVRRALAPHGKLFLFHQPPTPERVRPVVEAAKRALEGAGFRLDDTRRKATAPAPVVALIASIAPEHGAVTR